MHPHVHVRLQPQEEDENERCGIEPDGPEEERRKSAHDDGDVHRDDAGVGGDDDLFYGVRSDGGVPFPQPVVEKRVEVVCEEDAAGEKDARLRPWGLSGGDGEDIDEREVPVVKEAVVKGKKSRHGNGAVPGEPRRDGGRGRAGDGGADQNRTEVEGEDLCDRKDPDDDALGPVDEDDRHKAPAFGEGEDECKEVGGDKGEDRHVNRLHPAQDRCPLPAVHEEGYRYEDDRAFGFLLGVNSLGII